MGKLTISMAIFHSYVKLPEGIWAEKRWMTVTNAALGEDEAFPTIAWRVNATQAHTDTNT